MWSREGLNLIENPQGAVVKAEISEGLGDLPAFDEKSTVTGHAGKGEIGGIDGSNIPKVRDQNPAVGILNKLAYSRTRWMFSRQTG